MSGHRIEGAALLRDLVPEGLTDGEQKRAVRDLYDAGWQIARLTVFVPPGAAPPDDGPPSTAVPGTFIKHARGKHAGPYSRTEIAELRRLRRSGLTFGEIGERLGRRPASVARRYRRLVR